MFLLKLCICGGKNHKKCKTGRKKQFFPNKRLALARDPLEPRKCCSHPKGLESSTKTIIDPAETTSSEESDECTCSIEMASTSGHMRSTAHHQYPFQHVVVHNQSHQTASTNTSYTDLHGVKPKPSSGSVVQYLGLSNETISSRNGQSDCSTICPLIPEPNDELTQLLNILHLNSAIFDLQNLHGAPGHPDATNSSNMSSGTSGDALTPQTFRDHVERFGKEHVRELRKERDRLMDQMVDMEVETITGRITEEKLTEQVEELTAVNKDLEEQLKELEAENLELSLKWTNAPK